MHFIACDIDHTLLADDGELHDANLQALRRARDAGATVVLATARSYAGAKPVHDLLGLDTPLVVSNGTLVVGPDGGVLHAETLEPDVAREIVGWFRDAGHHWSFRTLHKAYLHPEFDTSRPPWSDPEHYVRTPAERLDELLGDYAGLLTASLFGMPLRAFYHGHDWSARRLTADFYPASHYSRLEAVSVMRAGVSKGRAVGWLRAHLGLAEAPTLAIGDSPADASMFALGVGVAPANALPEVRAAADWVAPHCDDCAVAAAVERFVLRVI